MSELLINLRGLGFGGMLGAGLSMMTLFLFPNLFPPDLDPRHVAVAGGLIGAGCHQLIEKWFIQTFLKPVGLFICYYSRIARIAVQIRLTRAKITPGGIQHLTDLVNILSTNYYLYNRCP